MAVAIRHIFIINPAAGKGTEAKKLCEKITDACRVANADFMIYKTTGVGDATRFVRETVKAKADDEILRFYACGGDGTLSEVVSGAVDESVGDAVHGVEVGCVPIGTGNDFTRNFQNRQFFSDITKQILADAVPIDCYKWQDDRYGINMINVGFDCEVVVKCSVYKKKFFMPKSLAYIAGIVVELIKNRGKEMTVMCFADEPYRKNFQLVSAANGGFCGGGFHSAPRSSLCDGLLDISLIDKVNRRQFISLVGSYKKGTHLETKLGKRIVKYIKAKGVTLEFADPTNVCIDGEVVKLEKLELSVIPKAVNFAVPVGCILE